MPEGKGSAPMETAALTCSSPRSSTVREFGEETGVAGSFERHSHGRPDVEKERSTGGSARRFSACRGSVEDPDGLQQQTVQTRLRQHSRTARPAGAAFAAPTVDESPTIARKAISESRR